MKKRKVLMLGFILALCVLVGFATIEELNENFKSDIQERLVDNTNETNGELEYDEPKNQITGEQSFINEEVIENATSEVLTEKDKLVKSEISKYSDTMIDFRYNKKEIIQDKSYNITFSKFSSNYNPSKVIYKNDLGNSFEYDINTGKLCNVTIKTNIVNKTTDSIDMDTAHKIALEHFPDDCDISEYTNDVRKERENGYVFWYTRYIGKYMTTDAFRIQIGFDGSIIDINDATDVFDGKALDFDEKFVSSKIQKHVSEKENVSIESVIILVSDEKICADCSCKQTLTNNEVSTYHINIPLE